MNNFNYIKQLNPIFVKYNEDENTSKYMLALYFNRKYIKEVLYFEINSKILSDYKGTELETLFSKINNASTNKEIFDILVAGNDTYKLGTDYYMSTTFYKDFSGSESEEIPTYVITDYANNITENSDSFTYLGNIKNKDIDNIEYFLNRNKIMSLTYDEGDLNNFLITFFTEIYDLKQEQNSTTLQNSIYSAVINYFKNNKSDCASTLINLLLTSSDSSDDCGCNQYNYLNTKSTCGCSSTSSTSTSTSDCSSLYSEKMTSLLSTMLSDLSFYCDWFMINNNGTLIPNKNLIDSLITLINDFETLGYSLNFSDNTDECGCIKIDANSSEASACNYKILDNYKQVLEWINSGEILENKNKIYVYGSQFASILPNMIF